MTFEGATATLAIRAAQMPTSRSVGCYEVGTWTFDGESGSEPVAGCYSDDDCDEATRCNAAEVCLPPPDCAPGAICPTVCCGMCVAD